LFHICPKRGKYFIGFCYLQQVPFFGTFFILFFKKGIDSIRPGIPSKEVEEEILNMHKNRAEKNLTVGDPKVKIERQV